MPQPNLELGFTQQHIYSSEHRTYKVSSCWVLRRQAEATERYFRSAAFTVTMQQTYLKYHNPESLYKTAWSEFKNFVIIDAGDTYCGLAVANADTRRSKLVPYLDDLVGNAPLTLLEESLKNLNAVGEAEGKDPFTGLPLFPLQVLNIKTMHITTIRNILNRVASEHNAIGFLFGFSADKRNWWKQKYKFIKKLVLDLEADGGLQPVDFSFIDEIHSTNNAANSIRILYPQLATFESFTNAFPLIKDMYGADDAALRSHLKDFYKGSLDCHAAINFSEKFLLNCFWIKTRTNDWLDKLKRMEYFASTELGFTVSGSGRLLGHGQSGGSGVSGPGGPSGGSGGGQPRGPSGGSGGQSGVSGPGGSSGGSGGSSGGSGGRSGVSGWGGSGGRRGGGRPRGPVGGWGGSGGRRGGGRPRGPVGGSGGRRRGGRPRPPR